MAFLSKAQTFKGGAIYISGKQAPVAATAITITAITKAAKAHVTAANTLLEGDLIYITGVAGMTEINGGPYIVENPTATDFTLANVDSTSFTTYTSSGEAKADSPFKACEMKDFSITGGQASEIDVTTLCSEGIETLLGLQDFGEASMNLNYIPNDPAIKEVLAAADDSLPRWIKVVYPAGLGVELFKALVKQVSRSIGVNQAMQGSVTWRLTGKPIYLSA
jgi:hypothetical protein